MEKFWILVVVIIVLLVLAVYIGQSVALMRLAKKAGCDRAWYAWFPILHWLPILHCIRKSSWYVLWLAVAEIASFVLSMMSLGLWGDIAKLIASLAALVLILRWYAALFRSFGKSSWWAVLLCIPIVGTIWYVVLLLKMAFSDKVQYQYA